ncbi:MAG: type 4a pilus biogenesis protein PilO [Patescibacteria group bacterium]
MQLIAPIILILISGGLFVTWIDPQYQEIKDLQLEKARYDEALDRVVEIREARNQIQSRYNTIEDQDLDRLGKMIPSHIDNIRLILDVNSVANARQMTIRDIRINLNEDSSPGAKISVGNQGAHKSVGFRFTVVTTYENFKKFLDDLALSLRIIDVESVEISSIQDETSFYRFDVGIRTYWLPQE